MTHDRASGGAAAPLDARLARLTPQQRELLRKRLSGAAPAAALPASIVDAVGRLAPVPDGVPFPQAPAQQRIWFFERLQPGSGAYNLYQHYRLRGPLSESALAAAFDAIVARHAALRTSFGEENGKPVQTVHASATLEIERHDLSMLAPDQRELRITQLLALENTRPIDLSRAPLLRVGLAHVGDEDHVLMVVIHHIVGDAWSCGVLHEELQACYNASICRQPLDGLLPALPVRYPDIVQWQSDQLHQQKLAGQVEFWRGAMNGVSGLLALPTDKPRPDILGTRGASLVSLLPQTLVDRLEQTARTENATLFMALLAAFQSLLSRHAGQEDVVLGTPFANRGAEEFEPVIGLFANTLPLRGDLSGDPSLRQLLARTRSHCLDAFSNADAPLERIVDALALERVPGRSALFQAMFVLQPGKEPELQLHGLASTSVRTGIDTARFELTLSLSAHDDGMLATFDYNTDLFDHATIERLSEQYKALLEQALENPDSPMSQLPLLNEAQRMELLALADGGPAAAVLAPPDGGNLYGWIAAQAARTPQAVAVAADGRSLTYAELTQRAGDAARHLLTLGAAPGKRVALMADRSAEAMIGLLAIVATGAAYVPLDPSHPDERLRFMLDDSQALALLTPDTLHQRATTLAASSGLPVASTIQPAGQQFAAVAVAPTDAAYVIYTSGSTGTPKGVAVSHANAINLTQAFLQRHEFSGQRLLMLPSLQFDASVGDIFPALACGAALVLHPSPNELGPHELERYCEQHAITAIDAPAALWRRWTDGYAQVRHDDDLLPGLRMMMFGGEAVPLSQVRRFARLTGGRVTLSNHYGPTEATVCAAMLNTRDGAGFDGAELPIGRPLPGVQVHILDSHGQLAPRGVIGELCIGGAGVALGYLNAPQMNETRFVADTFATAHADGSEAPRLYRSGDLARWNADGTLHFVGRRDHQVKLRGFRIELGEVESAICECPGVSAAVATVHELAPGDRRLLAYFVAGPELSVADLRSYLASRLPDAMQPSLYQRLDALPLTVNGKIDRRALPSPSAQQTTARVLKPAATDTEAAIMQLWRELLGREEMSVDDEFFNVGGDSLLTLPLVFRLGQAFGVTVPLSAVFSAPTIEAMAKLVDDLRAGVAAPVLDLAAQAALPDDIVPARAAPPTAPRAAPRSVLITGATGFLGAYLLRDLLDTTDAEMVCLVRAATPSECVQRIRANLQSYGLWHDGDERRILPLQGDLAAPDLGLDAATFSAMAARVDVIFHNGGQVNFLAPYESLAAANAGGTLAVLRLASSVRLKPVHLVSTLGVYVTEDQLDATVRERSAPPKAETQQGGYNQSKWVAEQLALAARARGLPVAVYRPARITGDSRTGGCNLGDYFSSWIKGCVQLGLAPRMDGEGFDMAPVDYVSRAIVQLALGAGDQNGNFHFLNPHRMTLDELVATLRASGYAVDQADYGAWRTALQEAAARSRDNALATFAPLFPEQVDAREPSFDCSATMDAVAPLGTVCPPADRALLETYIAFMQQRGFLPAPRRNEAAA
ncbi:non-ribosomal peptide synthetase [Rugamonas aquatica]|uniref:Amino acid adenylation domain-containing protein n=1 Tax=Rugamonas aquatica TaxID=2743357 RepID=A0A6A7MUS3_9BURK|nr:non-ribosomal peptide synthetase [Rugamonas aquatica]MQA36886.1 amino acid adenylation domain-containing protein [Rugamonas aquatica]